MFGSLYPVCFGDKIFSLKGFSYFWVFGTAKDIDPPEKYFQLTKKMNFQDVKWFMLLVCVNHFLPLFYTMSKQLWESPLWDLIARAGLKLPKHLYRKVDLTRGL